MEQDLEPWQGAFLWGGAGPVGHLPRKVYLPKGHVRFDGDGDITFLVAIGTPTCMAGSRQVVHA